jgi:hypothetical protein
MAFQAPGVGADHPLAKKKHRGGGIISNLPFFRKSEEEKYNA